MPAFSEISAFRFGYGLSPHQAPSDSPDAVLADLRGEDHLAALWPGMGLAQALEMQREFLRLKRAERDDPDAVGPAFKRHKQSLHEALIGSLQITLARGVEDPTGLRERLMGFWSDHFTIRSRRLLEQSLAVSHAETALRPHLTGRFPDMLRAAVTHPMMLHYLDQVNSVGPNSRLAQKKPQRKLGLNENLAREVMELHTLGVGGSYTQDDVRQLAELLTGMRANGEEGFFFNPDLAEPGAEEVLGVRYGGDPATLEPVLAALDALALHPDTARHLSHKLAVHFIGPDPAPDLVAAMAERYLAQDGALLPVYEVLLTHPEAQSDLGAKLRQPLEFIAASLRALGLSGADVMALDPAQMRRHVYWPLRVMGQRWLGAPGPDGWPEEAEAWIAPQQLAARIQWALAAPRQILPKLPDPRDFVEQALGARASEVLRFAVPRAEARHEAIALVLVSPEFSRR